MKKLKIYLLIGLLAAVFLPIISGSKVSAGPVEDCEAAGGFYKYTQNSSTGEYDSGHCECPGGTGFVNGSCLNESDLRAALCEDSGGTPQYTPINGFPQYSSCECPNGKDLQGSTCVAPAGTNNTGNASLSSGDSKEDCDSNGEALSADNCLIIEYIVTAINILSGLAGLAIVASIVIAGYQYMTARDNAGQIQKARQRIIWAITALLVFIFMYALLNFVVPGGIL